MESVVNLPKNWPKDEPDNDSLKKIKSLDKFSAKKNNLQDSIIRLSQFAHGLRYTIVWIDKKLDELKHHYKERDFRLAFVLNNINNLLKMKQNLEEFYNRNLKLKEENVELKELQDLYPEKRLVIRHGYKDESKKGVSEVVEHAEQDINKHLKPLTDIIKRDFREELVELEYFVENATHYN